jgi:hypothetical protein
MLKFKEMTSHGGKCEQMRIKYENQMKIYCGERMLEASHICMQKSQYTAWMCIWQMEEVGLSHKINLLGHKYTATANKAWCKKDVRT